jgi:tyrosyl-tRNA synthetase
MAKINTDPQKIQEFLTRGVANIYPQVDWLKKLLNSGKQLSLYLGIDPTGPSLHLGHAINLEKLRQWQELGHKVILLIGDFTGMVGDPTDKQATRQPLSRKQILTNAKNYKKQASTFLKFSGSNKAELKYNSQWSDKLNFLKVLKLSSHFTVQRLLERDMFQERIKKGKPISLQEFMYPVLQAYDCVAMKVDGEMGGNDQTFNMLSGRDLMKGLLNKEKFVITMKLLTDNQGVKMGKTTGNMATLDSSATEIFGKIMSWTDPMILGGFELCTRVPMTEIENIKQALKRGANPRDYKFLLAQKIVAIYHGEKKAEEASQEFNKIFSQKNKPSEIEEFSVAMGKINPTDLLVTLKFVSSKSEARRLITGGGLKINDQKITDSQKDLNIKSGDIIQAGKRKFGKIK